MAAVTELPFPARVVVRADLPEDVHEVPLSPGPEGDAAVAETLLRALHPGWYDASGALTAAAEPYVGALRERYVRVSATRRASGALLTAVCGGLLDGEYSASLLTVHAVELAYDDPQVAVTGIGQVFRAEGPADADVIPLALPAGPAVGRVHAGADGAATAEVGQVDIHVAVPDADTLLVLELVCPTLGSFEAHAALAGTVAASLRVEPRPAEGAA